MRILIPMFEIQDYGGITGHTEYLIKGLQEHGHKVDFVLLRNNDQNPYVRKQDGPAHSYASATGGSVHLLAGWYGVLVMSYGTLHRATQFVEMAKGYDFIIWGLPCPYDNGGCWMELYTSGVPQVACIHDAHYPKAYKHLDMVVDYLSFLAPVNESAYGALATWPGEKRLINNGHKLLDWKDLPPWDIRQQQAVCAHVWKAWKRMDRVVAAAPHMRGHLVMGGDGIEGRYMRSLAKCPPKFIGLWDTFLAYGGQYMGVMTEAELFALYEDSSVMIDISYNARFASYGCHYNRSIVEALNHGCLPLMCEESMAGSVIFDRNTYVGVSKDASPEKLAEAIDAAINFEGAEDVIAAGREVLTRSFDYRYTCLLYLA